MTPTTELGLSDMSKAVNGPLRIVGGGTRPIGHVMGEVLSTAALSGITLHEPGALTLVARAGTPVVDIETSSQMAAALGDKKVMIHQNHGHITTGGSVDAAVWWFIALERCMQSQLLAMSAGTPIEVSDEIAQQGWEIQGQDLSGWFQFQPLWDELVAREPEFLD